MFFYRLGHIPELALAEFNSTNSLNNSRHNNHFLLDKSTFELPLSGSFIYGGEVISKPKSENDIAEGLYEALDALYQKNTSTEMLGVSTEKKSTKKLGISILVDFNSKNLISLAHEIGFKKINILQGREPNLGHFKDIKDWLIVFEFYGEIIIGHITQTSNQEIFAQLDTGLPGGSMRRGKMNLKLALSLLNLANKQNVDYLWDPFCGQGGIVFIDQLFNKKPIIATDLERSALKDLKLNIDWMSKNFPIEFAKTPILHTEKLDATKLAKSALDSNIGGVVRKNTPKFEFDTTAIVTEGYLGPRFGTGNGRVMPSIDELYKVLDEIEAMWKNLIQQAQILKIPEIIFCLPAYRYKSNQILRVESSKIVENSEYVFDQLLPEKISIDYSRPNSFVIHQIQRVLLKK